MKSHLLVVVSAALLATSSNLAAQQSGYRVEAEVGSSVAQLTGGRADWRDTYLDVQARSADRQSYYTRLRTTERFEQTDREAMLGSYQPLGGAWALQVEAAVSPTHRVLAKNSLLAQLERRFDDGWGLQVGYRRSRYERTGTDLVVATAERYFSNFRAAYSLYFGRPDGTSYSASHRLQWSYYYSDHSFVGIAAAVGKEAENIFPAGVLTNRVRSLTLSGRHEFTPGLAASYELFTHRQGDLFTRRGFGLGLRHTF